jgi:hypothetical protein
MGEDDGGELFLERVDFLGQWFESLLVHWATHRRLQSAARLRFQNFDHAINLIVNRASVNLRIL